MNDAFRIFQPLYALTGACLAAFLTCGMASVSAVEPIVESRLIANRVLTVAGAEVFKPADKANPGDVIEYRARYANKGAIGVAALAATIPVPPGTEYWNGTARPNGALASADGINFSQMPLKRSVRTADGKTRDELVPTAEYRALRWELGALPAGADAVVSLRVRVTPATPPAKK